MTWNKWVKRGVALTLIYSLMLPLTGCKSGKVDFDSPLDKDEIAYTFEEKQTYQNGQAIEGQWGQSEITAGGEYGIGDPFVMRFDGKYYMYPSSSTPENGVAGIKVFSSDDMVNWTYEGFAVEDEDANFAYAPEVVYYNGWFYLCESKSGQGHFIFKSQSPVGPFEKITDNFGRNIDGAFWIGDDGQLFFLYPESNVMHVAPIDMSTMLPGVETTLAGTLNGWTEGPGFFRRGDMLYMTYTGNAVTSDSYRVGYSYQFGTDPQGLFVMPDNNIIILETGPDNFRGLGHSSNVHGPDLDSWYTAYHNLIATAGPQRRYMVDKLVTNGSMVVVNGPTYWQTPVPDRPDFETRGTDELEKSGALMLSKDGSEAVFTAELNFIPKQGGATRLIFSYTDSNNYCEVVWDDSSKNLSVNVVSGGSKQELGSCSVEFLSADVLHTVRIEQGAGRLIVYLDAMRKVDVERAGTAGKIGVTGDATFSYLAFSNDAFGTSDFETVKVVEGSFPAVHYLKGENRGFSIDNAAVNTDGIRQGEKENTIYDENTGAFNLKLDTAGDWVKYAIEVCEDDYYGVEARISAASEGAKFQIILDGRDIYNYTVPSSGLSEQMVNLILGHIPLTEGQHTLKLRLVEGTMEVSSFTFEATNPTELTYENALNEINEKGWSYIGNWKIIDGAHTARSGDTAFAYAGDDKLTDFTLEVEVAMTEDATIYDAGIMLRAKHHVVSNSMDESFCGYYLSLRNDQVTLSRYNYGAENIDLVGVDWMKGEYHKVKVVMNNNHILVYLDDMETPALEHYDPNAFLVGQVALCSNKAGCAFRNFMITTQ